MTRSAIRLIPLPFLMCPLAGWGGPAVADKPLVLEKTLVNRDVRFFIQGEADLPDGAMVSIQCQRLEKGKPVPAGAWRLLAEVKEKRFEASRVNPRTAFRPGRFAFSVGLAERQPDAVAASLTEAQRRFRLAGVLEVEGGDHPLLWMVLDLSRPIVTGLREAAAPQGPADAAASRLEKALSRKELPYFLPSASLLLPLLGRIRQAAAPPAPAGNAPDPAPAQPAPAAPGSDEVTQALRPIALEGLEMFAVALNEILDQYSVLDNNKVRTVAAMTPDKQAQVNQQANLFVSSWAVYKSLPWQEAFPAQFLQQMEEIAKDVRALPAAKSNSGAAKDDKTKRERDVAKEKEESRDPLEVILPRLTDQLSRFRVALTAESSQRR